MNVLLKKCSMRKQYIVFIILLFLSFQRGMAVESVITGDGIAIEYIACDRFTDSLSLVNLYQATGGASWNISWDLNQPVASWFGVNINTDGCVIGISLPGNNLTGFLPNLNLQSLEFLNLSNNNLFGGLPSMGLMNELRILLLNNNSFTGFLPSFFNNSKLERIEIRENILIGTIPSYSNLSVLQILDLRNNGLVGNIPLFSNCVQLRRLTLNNNSLGGNVPNFSLPNLRSFEASNNNLFGNLPGFSGSDQIEMIDLRMNNLSGQIAGFPGLFRLVSLFLDNNNFFGTFPDLTSNSGIVSLSLANNRLSGEIPNLNYLFHLQELNISNNNFTKLPNLSGLSSLTTLLVAGNMLTFEDLLPNKNAAQGLFTYAPQNTFGADTTILVDLGSSYLLELDFDQDVEGNIYRWFKNGEFVQESGEGIKELQFDRLRDRGDFTCMVRNPELTGLFVYSRTYRFRFNGGSPNDLCENAIDLSDSTEICHTYTVFDVEKDLSINLDTCNFSNFNIWYKFTAKGHSATVYANQINIDNAFLAAFDFGFTPCVSEAAIFMDCGLFLNLQDLIPGREYFIALYGLNHGDPATFDLCLINNQSFPRPANDFPCTAQGISPNVCLAGNNALARPDILNPSCLDHSAAAVWYKTRLSSGMTTLIIDIDNNNFFGNASVRVGTFTDGCEGEFEEVPGGSFCQRGSIFQIPGLESETDYYIQIATAPIDGGAFILCISESGRQLICGENNECEEGQNGPIDLPVFSNGGVACYSGCSTDAPSGFNQGDNSCFSFYNPTVWYTFHTDEIADFITLTITSSNLIRPYFSLFRTEDCLEFEQVICKVEGNGAVRLDRFPVDRNAKYYLAVSDFYGQDGLFSLCLASHTNTSACNVDNELVATQTSMGSPLNGPYLPGEEVTFCYTINSWQFQYCNWLQAIIPTFGPCWDESSFDVNGQPVRIDNFFNPFSEGEWIWLEADSATYNVNNLQWGYRQNDLLPAGWYYINQNSGVSPDELNVNNSFGDGIRCALDSPTWQVCFTLRASEELNCSERANCNISMKTLTDGEVGGKGRAGCLGDVPTFFNAYLDCCNNPVVEAVNDYFICSGTQLEVPLIGNDPAVDFNVVITPNSNIIGAQGGRFTGAIQQTLINQSDTTQVVIYTIIPESEGCLGDPVVFKVTIFPSPQVTISIDETICQGDLATLEFQFSGIPPFNLVYSEGGVIQPEIITSEDRVSLSVAPNASLLYEIVELTGGGACNVLTPSVSAPITVNPVSLNELNPVICEGDQFVFEGNIYNETGVYDIVMAAANRFGCDSTIRISLTVGEIYSDTVQARICFGESYIIGNNNLKESGNYIAVLPSQFSCDSVIFLNLRVGAELAIVDSIIINDQGIGNGAISISPGGGFPPYSFVWSNGSTAPLIANLEAGIYTVTVTDVIGCERSFNFNIRDLTSTNEIRLADFSAKVWPVPNKSGADIFLEMISQKQRNAEVIIRASTGQVVGRYLMDGIQGQVINRLVAPPMPGLYLLEIILDDGRRSSMKILVI